MGSAALATFLMLGSPQPDVAWEAPEGCPTADEVRARIAVLLARHADGLPGVTATLRVEPTTAQRWWMTLQLRGPGVDRRGVLEADSCAELAEDGAMLVARAVQPALADTLDTAWPTPSQAPEPEPDPAPEPEPEPEPEAAPEPAPEPTPAPEPETPRERKAWFVLEASAGPTGLLNSSKRGRVVPSQRISIGVRGEKWMMSISQHHTTLLRNEAGDADAHWNMRMWGVGWRLCTIPLAEDRLEFRFCGNVEGGRMTLNKTGADPASESRRWLALGASTTTLARLTRRVWLSFDVTILGQIRRPEFTLADANPGWYAHKGQQRWLIGLEVRI